MIRNPISNVNRSKICPKTSKKNSHFKKLQKIAICNGNQTIYYLTFCLFRYFKVCIIKLVNKNKYNKLTKCVDATTNVIQTYVQRFFSIKSSFVHVFIKNSVYVFKECCISFYKNSVNILQKPCICSYKNSVYAFTEIMYIFQIFVYICICFIKILYMFFESFCLCSYKNYLPILNYKNINVQK